jgi:hypothetical protein
MRVSLGESLRSSVLAYPEARPIRSPGMTLLVLGSCASLPWAVAGVAALRFARRPRSAEVKLTRRASR